MRIEPANAVPWSDVEHALTHGGNGSSCWCQWPVHPDYPAMTAPAKHGALREELAAATLAPALVAFIDDEAAAWCRIGPRTRQARLVGLSIVKRGTAEPLDDESVWAVSCFVVRREFRGQGLARALLEHGVEFARSNGARVIEGYPIDLAERPGRPPDSPSRRVRPTAARS